MSFYDWFTALRDRLWHSTSGEANPLVTAALALKLDPAKVAFSDEPAQPTNITDPVTLRLWLSDGTFVNFPTGLAYDDLVSLGSVWKQLKPIFPNYQGNLWYDSHGIYD